MTQIAKKLYSHAEYFALEDTAKDKSEYYKGQIFQMAGANANHNRIALNVAAALLQAFANRPCEAFSSDMKVAVEVAEFYTYPDVVALCGEIEFAEGREDTITNPALIVEVLSKSTRRYDRHEKFDFYKQLTSLQEYILIDQKRIHIEYYRKLDNGTWQKETFDNLSQTLTLKNLAVDLPLAHVYSRVKLVVGGQ